MRVALAVDNNMITEHFGHCEYFVIYDIEDKEIKGSEIFKNPPHQTGLLPKLLAEKEVNVVITGNMGKMAIQNLKQLNIESYRCVSGTTVDVIQRYINGELEYSDQACNQHRHHGEH